MTSAVNSFFVQNVNDNNINAISQDSNNVASTVNAANQIGVTVLPIPGKRSVRLIESYLLQKERREGFCGGNDNNNTDALASDLYSQMTDVHEGLGNGGGKCHGFRICLAFKKILFKFGFDDLLNLELAKAGQNPSVREISCQKAFPGCNKTTQI